MFAKFLLTGLAVASFALAQGMGTGGQISDPGGMGGGRGAGRDSGGMHNDMGAGGGGMRAQKETKADMIANRLKLSGDQRSEFSTILASTIKDAAPIIQNLLTCREKVANALINSASETDLAPLTQALNDAQFQMTGVEVKAFQRVVGLLKPNQVAKAPEAFDLMGEIFLPPMTRGGRGGDRGADRGGDRGK